MEAAGVPAEFNPFHNGHLAFLASVREARPSSVIVALMSSAFTQRGEAAFLGEGARTRAALLGGADVVLALPFAFSAQTGEVFASGCAGILSALGCRVLACGSDLDTDLARRAASLLNSEPESLSRKIREGLGAGLSFTASRHRALTVELGEDTDALRSPFNILSLEYERAVARRGLEITVERYPLKTGPGVARASAIRDAMSSGADVSEFIPGHCYPQGWEKDRGPSTDAYAPVIKALLSRDPLCLASLDGWEPGMENAAMKNLDALDDGVGAFVAAMTGRRWAASRIRRITASLLTGCTASDVASFRDFTPSWVRVAGLTRPSGAAWLREAAGSGVRLTAAIPSAKGLDPVSARIASLERTAFRIRGLFGNGRFTGAPVVVDRT